jgi:hypothetical protein
MQHLAGVHTTEMDLQRQGAALTQVMRVIAQIEQVHANPETDPGTIGFLSFHFPCDDEAEEYRQDLNGLTVEQLVALLPTYRMMAAQIRDMYYAAQDVFIEAVVRLKQLTDQARPVEAQPQPQAPTYPPGVVAGTPPAPGDAAPPQAIATPAQVMTAPSQQPQTPQQPQQPQQPG